MKCFVKRFVGLVFVFTAVISGYTYALMPQTGLERYDYSELYLLRTVPLKNGSRVACFGTRDDKVVWVGFKGRPNTVGNRFGVVEKVEKDFVVIYQPTMDNDGDWIAIYFEWPIATDMESLAERCGNPPPECSD